ncbi:MAG: sortase, partial [Oscillospiraceae bacterium]|nr:sortase [Oscillospiraceae bacterium]
MRAGRVSFGLACVRAADALVSFVLALSCLLCGLYAAYALWDNAQVYRAARDVHLELLALKPEAAEAGPSFEELLALNADVRGWLTLEGTDIDYPVLQGENNLSYINTDVYGRFALAGSIFLDSRNAADFSDPYNLIYGHHMAHGSMFGDLDRYLNAAFFE